VEMIAEDDKSINIVNDAVLVDKFVLNFVFWTHKTDDKTDD